MTIPYWIKLKIIVREFATYLSGCYVELNIYPFSFKEILKHHNEINNMEWIKLKYMNLIDFLLWDETVI